VARPDKQTHSAKAASRVIVEPLVHLIEEDTCPQAWLRAVEYLSNHDAAYNLVLAVRRPEVLTPADFAIHDRVDAFLREYDRPSLATIAGTIFPAWWGGRAVHLPSDLPQDPQPVGYLCDPPIAEVDVQERQRAG